jgi:biotin carboxyl carrier protein
MHSADKTRTPRDVIDLRHLQRDLIQAITASADKQVALQAVAGSLAKSVDIIALVYFGRDDSDQLAAAQQHTAGDGSGRVLSSELRESLLASCNAACEHGHLQIRELGREHLVAISSAVFVRQRLPEAFSIVVQAAPAQRERLCLVAQLVAVHLTLWHVLQSASAVESEAQAAAALVELLGKLESCADLQHACFALVSELHDYVGCQRVALGLRRGAKGCRLRAISGMAQFDARSDIVRALEAALDEALLRDDLSVWPSPDESTRHALLAHQKLCAQCSVSCAVSSPLCDEHGDVVGVWLLLGDSEAIASPEKLAFIRGCRNSIGICLHALLRAEGGPVTRLSRRLGRTWNSWRARIAVAAVILVLAALVIPVPYKIGCDCQIQPVTRRFVAAPYDATLEKSLVAPGDVVSRGDVLARIDEREIRWELAGLVADYHRAGKQRDAAMASHNVVEAQLAKLEMERLELKIRLLEHRVENLEIKSPIDGIVISGDLEKAEGAPLAVGQTLFEIGPLDKMIVEIEIPEDEIAHAEPGQNVSVRLDAYPQRKWGARIEKIHPRSEVREHVSVFVAEISIDNSDRLLRPGMNGRAKLTAARHTLAWNLFHKPWDWCAERLGW